MAPPQPPTPPPPPTLLAAALQHDAVDGTGGGRKRKVPAANDVAANGSSKRTAAAAAVDPASAAGAGAASASPGGEPNFMGGAAVAAALAPVVPNLPPIPPLVGSLAPGALPVLTGAAGDMAYQRQHQHQHQQYPQQYPQQHQLMSYMALSNPGSPMSMRLQADMVLGGTAAMGPSSYLPPSAHPRNAVAYSNVPASTAHALMPLQAMSPMGRLQHVAGYGGADDTGLFGSAGVGMRHNPAAVSEGAGQHALVLPSAAPRPSQRPPTPSVAASAAGAGAKNMARGRSDEVAGAFDNEAGGAALESTAEAVNRLGGGDLAVPAAAGSAPAGAEAPNASVGLDASSSSGRPSSFGSAGGPAHDGVSYGDFAEMYGLVPAHGPPPSQSSDGFARLYAGSFNPVDLNVLDLVKCAIAVQRRVFAGRARPWVGGSVRLTLHGHARTALARAYSVAPGPSLPCRREAMHSASTCQNLFGP